VSHTNYSPPVDLLICARYCTITPLHALYGRLMNFSSTCHDFPLNLVKDCLVTWLLQSGMDDLLISDFHPLLTPSNAVWKLTFSNSPSTPLPCCPPSDCLHLWFSTTTECARIINACPLAGIPGRRQLHSSSSSDLLVPRSRTATGQRAFAIYGLALWNRLPASLRSPELSLFTFRRNLKTYLMGGR